MKIVSRKGFTLVELMIVVAIIGILAAVAIPNFIKFQAKSKQSEIKANLKTLFSAQTAYMGEKETYSTSVALIGFKPERNNRYYIANGCAAANLVDRSVAAEAITNASCGFSVDTWKGWTGTTTGAVTNITSATGASAAAVAAGTGVCVMAADTGCVATGNTGAFYAVGAANIDNDPSLDTWGISSMNVVTAASTLSEAGNIPPGTPLNNINDVMD